MSVVHSVKFGGQTMDFGIPPRLSVRHDISQAASEARTGQLGVRVLAATLLLCWVDAGNKTGKDLVPRYRGDILAYGGDALDYLLPRGLKVGEIVEVGNVLIEKVRDAVVSAEQLEEARGNSAAPEGG